MIPRISRAKILPGAWDIDTRPFPPSLTIADAAEKQATVDLPVTNQRNEDVA